MDFLEILGLAKDTIVGVWELFTSLITLLKEFAFIIPTPYRSIILFFLTINSGIIIWKLVRS